jgi:predicted metal-dependent hydrolase
MADKPEVNKSQAIRDHFKSNPKAKTQEVVDASAKQGITVSGNLVRITKSKHNQRQAAKKAAKPAAASEATTNDVNKSQAIRDYLKANKKAKAPEVVDALAKTGITVTAGLVHTVKAKHKRRWAVKTVVENVVAEGGVGVPEIKAAFAFLKAVGSVAVAKQALAAAVEIRKIV